MPRIESSDAFADVELGDVGQGDRINLGVAAIMTRLPEVAKALGGLNAALRLRIAFHNQCRSCMAVRYQSALDDRLTEGAVCSLEQPAEADDLSDAERSAVRFADLFATNHLAIDDSGYDELRAHFTEDQLVELGLNCAVAVGIGRLTATWDVTDDVPVAFRSDSDTPVAPWVSGAVVASG